MRKTVADLPTTLITCFPMTTDWTSLPAARHRVQPAGHGNGRVAAGNTTQSIPAEVKAEAVAPLEEAAAAGALAVADNASPTAAATVNPCGIELDAVEEVLESGVLRQEGHLRRQRRGEVANLGRRGAAVGAGVVAGAQAWRLAPMKGTRGCGRGAGWRRVGTGRARTHGPAARVPG